MESIVLFTMILFATESIKNVLRIYQTVRKRYVNPEIVRNLQNLTWVLIASGIVLGFTSNVLFLPMILIAKVAAGMVVEYYFGEGRKNADIDELIRSNSHKLIMTKEREIKLIGEYYYANHH